MRKLIALTFLCFFFLTPQRSEAQISETDSLALLDIYFSTDGPNWINNTNWGVGPVSTWFGIEMPTGSITGIKLADNNLVGTIPATINELTDLQGIDISGNHVSFISDLTALFSLNSLKVNDNLLTNLPQTAVSIIADLICHNNFLAFNDLEPFVGFVVNDFTYAPQGMVGEPSFRYASLGSDVGLSISVGGSSNFYTWRLDEVPISSPNPSPNILLPGVTAIDEGDYTCVITNPLLPDLSLFSRKIDLRLLLVDSMGGEYVPNQMIVEFTDDAGQFEKDTLLDFYQATRIDSCLCGIIELWLLPDTSFLPGGQIIVGVEDSKEDAMNKSKVEDAARNYFIFVTDDGGPSTPPAAVQTPTGQRTAKAPPSGGAGPLIAVVDVGIDYLVSLINPAIWINAAEGPDEMDNDENCLVDDNLGFNFADRNNDPRDLVSGHGTHVAGIILGVPTVLEDFSIMALKSHGDDGSGFLFNGLCAIYYAADKEAIIINLSWGYYGEESSVFKSALARAGEDCGALVVTSAGNTPGDNDVIPHYPSNFDLPNIISVAALNSDEDGLYSESSFGLESVDIAAPGVDIESIVPGGGLGLKSGTSMAAAAVTRVAGRLYLERPDLTYVNIRNVILNTAEPVPALSDLIATGGKVDLDAALLLVEMEVPDTSCIGNSVSVNFLPEKHLEVLVYPQPFQQEMMIAVDYPEAAAINLEIYNSLGQLVHQNNWEYQPGLEPYRWYSGDLPNGFYFLQMDIEGLRIGQKLLKLE